jgi:uncharacterized protein YxeA
MNQLFKLKNIGIIIIILTAVILIVLGIRFINFQNIQYQQSNKETVVEEEIKTKIQGDKQIEKEPIKPQEQKGYEEKGFQGDSLMIF